SSAGQKGVAQDSEHPRAKICSFLKAAETLDSLDEGFLHQIPRLLRVTAQPASEVVQGIEQRQRQLFKFAVRKAAHAFNRLQLLRPPFYSRQARISVAGRESKAESLVLPPILVLSLLASGPSGPTAHFLSPHSSLAPAASVRQNFFRPAEYFRGPAGLGHRDQRCNVR